jgi:hypothetical protein
MWMLPPRHHDDSLEKAVDGGFFGGYLFLPTGHHTNTTPKVLG